MALDDSHRAHLRRCVELAREALDAGDDPFGSVLVAADGTVLAERRNRERTGQPVGGAAAAAGRAVALGHGCSFGRGPDQDSQVVLCPPWVAEWGSGHRPVPGAADPNRQARLVAMMTIPTAISPVPRGVTSHVIRTRCTTSHSPQRR